MLQKVEMYSIICDNCKEICGDEIVAWADKSHMETVAMESDWLKEGDKHYCPDCYSYDDDDNLVLKPNKHIVSNNEVEVCELPEIGIDKICLKCGNHISEHKLPDSQT